MEKEWGRENLCRWRCALRPCTRQEATTAKGSPGVEALKPPSSHTAHDVHQQSHHDKRQEGEDLSLGVVHNRRVVSVRVEAGRLMDAGGLLLGLIVTKFAPYLQRKPGRMLRRRVGLFVVLSAFLPWDPRPSSGRSKCSACPSLRRSTRRILPCGTSRSRSSCRR
jgi:hypothetical protein